MRLARETIVLVAGLAISGCGSDGLNDLRDFVKNAHADRKPNIKPIPEIKPQESFAYAAGNLPDPFMQVNLKPLARDSKSKDQGRRREPLEDYPLDALKMVGTLSRGNQSWAVIQAPDGTVRRVQVGSYLGQNSGKVIRITEAKVDVIEQIQGTSGDWVEREANLVIAD
jgi:type IV pilus assembly protein PilP